MHSYPDDKAQKKLEAETFKKIDDKQDELRHVAERVRVLPSVYEIQQKIQEAKREINSISDPAEKKSMLETLKSIKKDYIEKYNEYTVKFTQLAADFHNSMTLLENSSLVFDAKGFFQALQIADTAADSLQYSLGGLERATRYLTEDIAELSKRVSEKIQEEQVIAEQDNELKEMGLPTTRPRSHAVSGMTTTAVMTTLHGTTESAKKSIETSLSASRQSDSLPSANTPSASPQASQLGQGSVSVTPRSSNDENIDTPKGPKMSNG